jgi:membrane-associated phospholipid phosphatase
MTISIMRSMLHVTYFYNLYSYLSILARILLLVTIMCVVLLDSRYIHHSKDFLISNFHMCCTSRYWVFMCKWLFFDSRCKLNLKLRVSTVLFLFDKTSTIWLFKFKLAILKVAFVTVMYVVCATVIPYHDCFVDDTMLVNVFSQV